MSTQLMFVAENSEPRKGSRDSRPLQIVSPQTPKSFIFYKKRKKKQN